LVAFYTAAHSFCLQAYVSLIMIVSAYSSMPVKAHR